MKEQNNSKIYGNILREKTEPSDTGKPVFKTVEVSDLVLSQFGQGEDQLGDVRVLEMQLWSKKLDDPLPFFKSIMASMVGIKKVHEFLVFETDLFLITVDYYAQNRLVIRLGDADMVFEGKQPTKRKEATLVKQGNGLQWRRAFLKSTLRVRQLLDLLMGLKMKDFRMAFHNGKHFSRELFQIIPQILNNE